MTARKEIKIEPSILAGDFGRLADEAKKIEDAGGDGIHIDIMDGHFVPNLTMGPKAVAAINRATDLFLDVHIMVYNPFEYIERLIESGADGITFHFEATEDVEYTLNFIRKCKVKAGLAFCPETSISMIPKYLDKCDLMLLMSVHPGFGGQSFMKEALEKIKFIREICDRLDIRKGGITPNEKSTEEEKNLPAFDIQVDGGITDITAPLCLEAGANRLVSGTYLFESEDMASRIKKLRGGIPK